MLIQLWEGGMFWVGHRTWLLLGRGVWGLEQRAFESTCRSASQLLSQTLGSWSLRLKGENKREMYPPQPNHPCLVRGHRSMAVEKPSLNSVASSQGKKQPVIMILSTAILASLLSLLRDLFLWLKWSSQWPYRVQWGQNHLPKDVCKVTQKKISWHGFPWH